VDAIIEKLTSYWKHFKNYLKYKPKKMEIEDLILRLRIKFGNKLSEKIANSSRAQKTNVMEQAVKSYNKNNKKKLAVKGKGIVKKFNGKCFI